MNRTLLFALAGLSLAGNAWFLIARARESAASPGASSATAAIATPHGRTASPAAPNGTFPAASANETKSTPADAVAPRGVTWHAPTTDDEFRTFASDLRAAGFPPHVINRVVTELYQQRRRADSPIAKLPFWQRRTAQKEMQDYDRATAKNLETILGPDARQSARIDLVTRARQYGTLPDAKIDALAAVERDYQDMQRDLVRNPDGTFFDPEQWSERQQQRDLLKTEMRTDLEKILTPAELADYELRNSDAARSIAFSVREVAVNAAEFASLYEMRRAFDAANPPLTGRVTPEQVAARQTAELGYYEQVRTALPDDRFYDYLAATQADFRNLRALTKQFPSVTPAAAYQAMQLRYEMQRTRSTLFGPGGASNPESIQAAYANWNTRLDALLGTEAAAAYRKTNYGRMFVAPTPRPSNRTAPPQG